MIGRCLRKRCIFGKRIQRSYIMSRGDNTLDIRGSTLLPLIHSSSVSILLCHLDMHRTEQFSLVKLQHLKLLMSKLLVDYWLDTTHLTARTRDKFISIACDYKSPTPCILSVSGRIKIPQCLTPWFHCWLNSFISHGAWRHTYQFIRCVDDGRILWYIRISGYDWTLCPHEITTCCIALSIRHRTMVLDLFPLCLNGRAHSL